MLLWKRQSLIFPEAMAGRDAGSTFPWVSGKSLLAYLFLFSSISNTCKFLPWLSRADSFGAQSQLIKDFCSCWDFEENSLIKLWVIEEWDNESCYRLQLENKQARKQTKKNTPEKVIPNFDVWVFFCKGQSHKIQKMTCTEDSWVKSLIWKTISKCALEKYSWEVEKSWLFCLAGIPHCGQAAVRNLEMPSDAAISEWWGLDHPMQLPAFLKSSSEF